MQEKTIKTEQQKTAEPYRKGRVKAYGIVSIIAGFRFYVKGILSSQLVHVSGEDVDTSFSRPSIFSLLN